MAASEIQTRDELLEAAHAAASSALGAIEQMEPESYGLTLELRALRLTIEAGIAADEELAEDRRRQEFEEGYYDLELMGHRTRVGYVREVRVAGRYMLEIRSFETVLAEPGSDDEVTELAEHGEIYSGAAVFSMTPVDEEQARRIHDRPF